MQLGGCLCESVCSWEDVSVSLCAVGGCLCEPVHSWGDVSVSLCAVGGMSL